MTPTKTANRMLRLPPSLNRKLKAKAKAEQRSVNAQIIVELERNLNATTTEQD